jgi:hypothetical protein
LFCVFEVFQFVLDVGPIHPKRSQGLGCLSVSSIFCYPAILGNRETEKKNYKKPAAVDFSSRRCCCATFTSAYSAAAAHIQSVNLTGAVYAKVYGALTIMDRSTR